MDYRKLISFGKSSFVISLPKSWLEKNNIKKGGVIYLEEDGENLKIMSKEELDSSEERSISIDITDKKHNDIMREIVAAYIGGFSDVTVVGKDLHKKAKDIREILQNLMAFEIIDETSSKIVAKDFLDIRNISVISMIKRMDIITRSMMTDAKTVSDKDSCDNITHRDDDVNRMNYLILKVLRKCLKSSQAAKITKIKGVDILNHWWVALNIEMIADQAKRVARIMFKQDDKEMRKDVSKIMTSIEEQYIGTMKAFYEKDVEASLKIASYKEECTDRCNELAEKYNRVPDIVDIMNKLHTMIRYIHVIGRVIYT